MMIVMPRAVNLGASEAAAVRMEAAVVSGHGWFLCCWWLLLHPGFRLQNQHSVAMKNFSGTTKIGIFATRHSRVFPSHASALRPC